MIKRILILEVGSGTRNKAEKEAIKLCEELQEELSVVPAQGLVYDRFLNKYYSIYVICSKLSEKEKLRVQLFLDTFKIDYQYKLLERNYPDILSYYSEQYEK